MSMFPSKVGRTLKTWARKLWPGDRKAPPVQPPASRRFDNKTFEERLKHICGGSKATLAGRLYFVNLDEIREHYAEKWAQIQDLVYRGVANIIDQHLTIDDFYTRRQSAFMIVFPNLSEREAAEKCLAIAEDVQKHFLGHDLELPPLDVQSTVATVSGELGLRSVTEVDEMLADAAPAAEVLAQEPPSAGTPAIARAADPADASTPALPSAPAENDPSEWQTPKRSRIDLRYRAMWHTRSKTVASYLCTPYFGDEAGANRLGVRVARETGNAERLAALDIRVVTKVVDDLAQRFSDAQSAFVICPVHFRTLAEPSTRKRFVEVLARLPAQHKDRLVAEVIQPSERFTEMDVALIKSVLGPLTRAYLARLPLWGCDLSVLAQGGVDAVGVDLSDYDLPEAKVLPALEEFALAANTAGLRCYVHGLPSLSLTTAAVCAGFDNIDGDTIATLSQGASQVYPLDAKQLYAHLLTDDEKQIPA